MRLSHDDERSIETANKRRDRFVRSDEEVTGGEMTRRKRGKKREKGAFSVHRVYTSARPETRENFVKAVGGGEADRLRTTHRVVVTYAMVITCSVAVAVAVRCPLL